MIRRLFQRSWFGSHIKAVRYRLSSWAEKRRERIAAIRRERSWMILGFACEPLEIRRVMAAASFDSGTGQLSIVFEQDGSNAEAVTAEVTGGNIVLSGDVSGATSTSAASVTSIILSANGTSTAQQMTFEGGTEFTLLNGLTSTGDQHRYGQRLDHHPPQHFDFS
jgi:hypothetical protein